MTLSATMKIFVVLLLFAYIVLGTNGSPENAYLGGSLSTQMTWVLEEVMKLKTEFDIQLKSNKEELSELQNEVKLLKEDNTRLHTKLQAQEELIVQWRLDLDLLNISSSEEALKLKADIAALKNTARTSSLNADESVSSMVPFWSEWSEYSTCSASCGQGIQQRMRTCETPATRCSGLAQKEIVCNLGVCPVWSEWSQFNACSTTCGNGTKTRTRTCSIAGGCSGSSADTVICNNLNACPDVLVIIGGSSSTAEALPLGSMACDISLPDLPVDGFWGSFFTHRNDPVFCSSYGDSPCYKYYPSSNSWSRFSELTTMRRAPAILQLDDYILVTGGESMSQYLSSTDYWNSETGQFEAGPDLPYMNRLHCIATINSTHALMTGGNDGRGLNRAFMFDKDTSGWTEMEPMRGKRYNHACGMIGESKVIVAGGYDGTNILSSVEVFNLETQTWSQGEPLPYLINDGTSVQLEDAFLIVGGVDGSRSAVDSILEYDCSRSSWRTLEQRMTVKRMAWPAVYKLPAGYLSCA